GGSRVVPRVVPGVRQENAVADPAVAGTGVGLDPGGRQSQAGGEREGARGAGGDLVFLLVDARLGRRQRPAVGTGRDLGLLVQVVLLDVGQELGHEAPVHRRGVVAARGWG